MPSLLDDPYADPGQSSHGLLGLDMPQIRQPDPDTDQGAALGDLYQRIMAEQARQQQISADRGLWNPDTGLPTGAGMVSAANQTAQGILMGSTAPGIRAFHGSPYDFERFDTSKIGTGEGAQAYGHGLYFAEQEGTARTYRDALTADRGPTADWIDNQGNKLDIDVLRGGTGPKADAAAMLSQRGSVDEAIKDIKDWGPSTFIGGQKDMDSVLSALQELKDAGLTKQVNRGRMYEVNIGADPEQFLHWDKPLSEQSPFVNDAVRKAGLVDPKPTVEWQGDPALWELHQNGRPTGTMLEDAGDGRTYNEIINGKLTGSIPNGAVDAWKDMHAQSLRDAYRDPDPTGRDLIKNNPGIERELHTIGLPGIRYLDQGSRGAGQGTHNYVVFDAATIDILRKYGLAGLGIGLGSAAATRQQPEQ